MGCGGCHPSFFLVFLLLNNLYGFNPDWWQDKDYSEMGPYTYEEWIEEYASKEYIVFMYKYEGEWYVYPEILELAHIIWEVEF